MADDEEREVQRDGKDPTVTRVVAGEFLRRFRADGGAAILGAPVSGVEPVAFEPLRAYGDQMMSFERGTIFVDTATGVSSRQSFGWYAYVPLQGVDGTRPPGNAGDEA